VCDTCYDKVTCGNTNLTTFEFLREPQEGETYNVYQVTDYILGKLPTHRNFIFWIAIVRIAT
jgi:hypothetical protein